MPLYLGLVYEDEHVRIVFEAIARKILGEETQFIERLGSSWPGMKGDVPRYLAILDVEHRNSPMDKVFVVVDADREDADSREEGLRRKVQNRVYLFGTPHFYAITRQSETLLLGDPHAVNIAAGATVPPVGDPEALIDAKRHLIQQLRNAGGEFSREFVRRAASNLDVRRLETTCPQVRRLRCLLEDC